MRLLAYLTAIAALAASLAVFGRWHTLRELRFENALLPRPNQSASTSHETFDQASSIARTNELERLRNENQDLLRLRNQVRELRFRIPELMAARRENEQLLQAKQRAAAQATSTTPADR